MSDAILWCLVEGDDAHFIIRTSPTAYIADLKELIKKKLGNRLQRVDAPDLKLWQVRYFYPFFLTLWVILLYP